MTDFFSLKNTCKQTQARAGVLTTNHGTAETPIFMPVGTIGSVKGVHQSELENIIDAPIILGNTYHLYLKPGTDILEQAGGLHKFMDWNRIILTDSGGYQVYSLSNTRKITEKGVTFRSHIDGSKHFFSPEKAIDIQRTIGGDIIMAFDECPPYPASYDYVEKSMHMTHRWYKKCHDHFYDGVSLYDHKQFLFPIIQGGVHEDLRIQSTQELIKYDAPGYAIGGLSVGEPHEDMYKITKKVCEILPKDKPRYLMGVGTPENILEAISLGIDMFDCVLPTRNARHGLIYTSEGRINMKNSKWKTDFSPIDANIDVPTSNRHTKAYLKHLFHSKELLAGQIASIHNLSFFLWLVKEARKHIIAGDFGTWKTMMIEKVSRRL